MGCLSLVYVFAAMKMESQAVERLIGSKPDSASRAAVKPGQCGSNEVVLLQQVWDRGGIEPPPLLHSAQPQAWAEKPRYLGDPRRRGVL